MIALISSGHWSGTKHTLVVQTDPLMVAVLGRVIRWTLTMCPRDFGHISLLQSLS